MDKQLACATFATVIPVLLLAGYFAPGELDLTRRAIAIQVALVIAVGFVAELASIIGTAVAHPNQAEVLAGAVGACTAMTGFFSNVAVAVAAQFITDSDNEHHDEHDDGQGDQ